MRTHLRKIGNSRGVLIPATLLAELDITDEVEIHREGDRLVVEPLRRPRQGWFDHYDAQEDDAAWSELEDDLEEWQW